MINRRKPSESSLERVKKLELKLKEIKESSTRFSEQMETQVRNQLMKLKIKLDIISNDEKDSFIEELMEYALYAKTGEHRDLNSATHEYENVIELDRNNPEAHYRYAYLAYDKCNWLKAINHFQHAIDIHRRVRNTSNFPIAEDQLIKAKLFIGYCAAQISKQALKESNDLGESEFRLEYEGISIKELSDKLKQELEKTELTMITRKGKQGISRQKYIEILKYLSEEQLLLSFVEDRPFIQLGNDAGNTLSATESFLLKELLLKSVNNKPLPLIELNGYRPETGTMNEVSWEAYRRQISRLNNRLKESGVEGNIIEVDAGYRRYRIKNLDFYIVAREDQYL